MSASGATAVTGQHRVSARSSARARTNAADWTRRYARQLSVTDAIAVGVAIAIAYWVHIATRDASRVAGEVTVDYLVVSLVVGGAWLTALGLWRTRDRRRIGIGNAEFVSVLHASWRVLAMIAVLAYMLRMEVGRSYLALSFLLGLVLLIVGRFCWRKWLHAQRRQGRFSAPVLIIGRPHKAAGLIDLFNGMPEAGYSVVGVCIPTGDVAEGSHVNGVPVLGSMDRAAEVARAVGARAVAVSGADAITTETVRRLGWDLEGSGVDLALTLTLLDVAGPRVHMQPVNGLPLMYVDEPRFSGRKYLAKSVFDMVGAAALIIALAPVLLAVAIAVAVTSPGPVFYRQERIGRNGRAFPMLKFRSMTVDAHQRLAEVLQQEGVSELGVFYKPKNDPRVTRVGRVIRRYSLDELPQLFNVVRGEMSLVGPRPQISAEVAQYDRTAERRLLVKPGLTGLWQVSGRNSLGLTESIRLDVNYVENWTLAGDVVILGRTLKAMVGGRGAS